MIRIIKDPDNLYDKSIDIVVHNTDTFIKSRLLINQVKKEKESNLTISITKPSYFGYYADLYNIDGWCEIVEYSFVDIIKNMDIELNEKEIRYIQLLIYKEQVMDFLNSYNSGISLEKNLTRFIFLDGDNIDRITDIDQMINWVESSLRSNRAEWKECKYKELLEVNINNEIDSVFMNELLMCQNISDLQRFKYALMATYLFSHYNFSSRNILKEKVKLFDSIYVSEDYIKKIISENYEYIEEINFTIYGIKDKLSMFDTLTLDEFIQTTKGYLMEEWEWVWDYLKDNYKCDEYDEILSKIYIWININESRDKVRTLIKLLEFEEERLTYKKPIDIKGWYIFYERFYLRWFPSLNTDNNIINLLERIDDGFVKDTINEIVQYKEKINFYYSEFLFENYPKLLHLNETNLKVLNQISSYSNNNKILYFIIDGLRWELWDIVKSAFAKNNYFIENENQHCLSMIPSITSISRTSLISGKTFKTITKEKADEQFTFNVLNEEKHIKLLYPDKVVAFKNGGLNELEYLLMQDADIYGFVYSEGDSLFHAVESITSKAMESMLENLIDEIVNRIGSKRDIMILFGTDHGNTKEKGKEQINISIPDKIEEEIHGNSIKLFSNEFNEAIHKELKDSIDTDKIHVIWREYLEIYELPSTTSNEEIYAWLFPKNKYYYKRKQKGYSHGGLSLEETIIPYGTFRKQQSAFNKIKVEIINSRLAIDNISYIDFVFYNPNPFGVKKVIIEISKLNIKEVINDIASRDKRRVRAEFKLSSGKFEGKLLKEVMKLTINYLDKQEIQDYLINEDIEIKTVDAINESLSKKRTLDF